MNQLRATQSATDQRHAINATGARQKDAMPTPPGRTNPPASSATMYSARLPTSAMDRAWSSASSWLSPASEVTQGRSDSCAISAASHVAVFHRSGWRQVRAEEQEHTSELQSLMRSSN